MTSVLISLPFDNTPFITIGVATFDIVSGIKVVYQWNFSGSDEFDFSNFTFEDLFKINLCNVHHQDSKYYEDFKISTLEFPQFNIYMISSIFFLNLKPRNAHISLGIFLKSTEIKNNLYFNNFLNSKIQSISVLLRKIILESQSISCLTPDINNFVVDISNIIFSMKKKTCDTKNLLQIETKDADFSDLEFSFLAILLTSHLQTQMTTVIECQNSKQVNLISSFLEIFLLPSQRELSSFEIQDAPIPGLFLQFVRKKTTKNKLISIINKPTTWVKLSDQTVEQIVPVKIDIVPVVTPAPWACKTIQLVQQAPTEMQKMICDIQMKELSWEAASYSIIEKFSRQSHATTKFWSLFGDRQSNSSVPLNVLGSNIANEGDLKILMSIAQLFDPTLLKD